jgi:hypothetical protein
MNNKPPNPRVFTPIPPRGAKIMQDLKVPLGGFRGKKIKKAKHKERKPKQATSNSKFKNIT